MLVAHRKAVYCLPNALMEIKNYLEDSDGTLLVFHSKGQARRIMQQMGLTLEEMEEYTIEECHITEPTFS